MTKPNEGSRKKATERQIHHYPKHTERDLAELTKQEN